MRSIVFAGIARSPVLAVAATVSVLAAVAAASLLGAGEGWRAVDERIHAGFEQLEAILSVLLALLLLRLHSDDAPERFPLALGFLGKGVLDAFHAFSGSAAASALLHASSHLAGGLLFALAWRPGVFSGLSPALRRRTAWATAGATAAVALLILRSAAGAQGGAAPVVASGARIGVELLAGALFLAGALALSREYRRSRRIGPLLFACTALIFGACGPLYALAAPWSATWWLVHVSSIAACLLSLGFTRQEYERLASTYRDALAETATARGEVARSYERLESQVRERTEELTREVAGHRRTEEALRASSAALEERARLAELGARVGVALTGAKSLEDGLQRCCELLVGHVEGHFARIWTFNLARNLLELAASAGRYTHRDGVHARIAYGEGMIGTIAKRRSPHLTNVIPGDPLVQDQAWARREGIAAFAGHPLLIGDRLLGVMAVFAQHPLSRASLAALAAIADELALGIDQLQAEEGIRHAKEEWEQTFDAIPDLVAVIDGDYRILRANRALARKLGLPREAVLGAACYRLLHGAEAPPESCPHHRALEERREYFQELELPMLTGKYLLSITPIRDEAGGRPRVVHILRDISERKALEQRLEEAAITDELTGLLNRRGFLAFARKEHGIAERKGRRYSLLYLDLDGFKDINDRFGHEVGDRALRDCAQLLRRSFRETDVMGRIGGDEFAVLIPETAGPETDAALLEQLRRGLAAANDSSGRPYRLEVSLGLESFEPGRPRPLEEVIARADALMYRNKRRARSGHPPLAARGTRPASRRRAERYQAPRGLDALTVSGESLPVTNISLAGVGLVATRPLAGRFSGRLAAPGEDPVAFEGEVMWAAPRPAAAGREAPDGAHDVGIRFAAVTPELLALIDRICASRVTGAA